MNNIIEAQEVFSVRTENLFRADGSKVNALATVREDTNEAIGIVSDRYSIIQNTDLCRDLESSLQEAGLNNYSRKVEVGANGARFYARYTFPEIKVLLPKVGDELGLRIITKNSHDGSGAASWEVEILRLVCKNGARAYSGVNRLGQSHKGRINILSLSRQILTAANSFAHTVKFLSDLADVNITQDQGRNAIENLVSREILSLKIANPIRNIWEHPTYKEDRARNLYNLYNAVTQVLTHEVEPRAFELATRINTQVSKQLVVASTNAQAFNELVALTA